MSFWTRIIDFATVFVGHGWAFLVSGVIAAVWEFVRRYRQRWRFVERVASRDKRHYVTIGIVFIGFLYASFMAFDDANERANISEHLLSEERKARADMIPRSPREIYQGDLSVAQTDDFSVDQDAMVIVFPLVTASVELDMTQGFEFRDWKMICQGVSSGRVNAGAFHAIHYRNFTCRITGNR